MKLIPNFMLPSSRKEDFLEVSHKTSLFRYLDADGIENLRDHRALYSRVIAELGGTEDAENMSKHFNSFFEEIPPQNLQEVMVKKSEFIKSFYRAPSQVNSTDVLFYDSSTWKVPRWTYQGPAPELNAKKDITDLASKMLYNIPNNNSFYTDIRLQLTSPDSNLIDLGVVRKYIEGIKCEDMVVWENYKSAIFNIGRFLSEALTSQDVSLILEYCKTNEKFMFLLLYPYFFQPLGKFLWSYLLPVFHLKLHSFTKFMKDVALQMGRIINNQFPLVNGLTTLKMSRNIRIAIGTGGVSSILMLYNRYFISQNSLVIGQLYNGLSGPMGEIIRVFRLQGSNVIFETTKTLSTFSNAALAGFLEPKHEAFRQVISILKRR